MCRLYGVDTVIWLMGTVACVLNDSILFPDPRTMTHFTQPATMLEFKLFDMGWLLLLLLFVFTLGSASESSVTGRIRA